MATDAQRHREEGEWRCKDLRLWISMNVGRRQDPESPLSKKTLNSIHRYLSGSFHYEPKVHGTPMSSTVDELRHDLCITLANREYEPFEELVSTADTSNLVPASRSEAEAETRPFRKEELRGLRKAISSEEDQRPMSKKEVSNGAV